ncbi:MAG: DUF5050 domain-containing protein [Lachnospirales bacterium]
MRKNKIIFLLLLLILVSCKNNEDQELVKLEDITISTNEDISENNEKLELSYSDNVSFFATMTSNSMVNSKNNGYVLEEKDLIIYSDNKGIFVIHKDLGIYEKLSSVSGKYLNVYNNNLFFYNSNSGQEGIYKLSLISKEIDKIYDGYTDKMCLYNGFIYLQCYSELNENIEERYVAKVDLEGNFLGKVFSYTQDIFSENNLPLYFCIYDNNMYYINIVDNMKLTKIDLRTNRETFIADIELGSFTLDDFSLDNEYIYFTKKGYDTESKLFLCRYNLNNGETETVVSHMVWNYVIDNDYIYYINGDKNFCLYRRNKWDNTTIQISDRQLNYINVIDDLLYVEDNFNGNNHFWFTKNGREVNLSYSNINNFFEYDFFDKSKM